MSLQWSHLSSIFEEEEDVFLLSKMDDVYVMLNDRIQP